MLWWWVGNLVGLVAVVPLVLVLAVRVLRPALEIRRYAQDIAERSNGVVGNVTASDALDRTREAVAAVKDGALRYATALDRSM